MTFFFVGSPTGLNNADFYRLAKVIIVGLLLLSFTASASADEQEDLAKESQNPIGNIISLPFENNFAFGVGPEDAFVYTLNLKPVYPMTFGKVNLINRFSLSCYSPKKQKKAGKD
jgi:hypothetical protein